MCSLFFYFITTYRFQNQEFLTRPCLNLGFVKSYDREVAEFSFVIVENHKINVLI